MDKITALKELLIENIRDLYNAEVLTVSELLYFKKLVHRTELRELIHNYIYDSRAHITTLEELLDDLNASLMEEHCRTMKSIILESKILVQRCREGIIRDLAIIFSLQRMNTCKISAYNTIIRLAGNSSNEQNLHRLQDIFKHETDLEAALDNLATEIINLKQPAL
jgi:ferritin-like metal-binding protein YciE